MIELVVNGQPYKDYLNAALTISMQSLANDFVFTTTAVRGVPPFKLKARVQVNIDGVQRLNGFIEEISGSDDEGGFQVTFSGRDRTGDFIDSSVNNLNDIRPPITVKGVIDRLVKNIGGDLKVIDQVSPKKFNRAVDVIDHEDGTRCLDVAFLYARKRQCLLSSDADGNIVIKRAEPTLANEKLQNIQGGDNNIISQTFSMSTTSQFNRHIYKAQLDTRAANQSGVTSIDNVVNQSAIITDDSQRKGRQNVVVQSDGYDRAELKDLATWGKQLAKAEATRYSCTVKGHATPRGNQWQENTLVMINSDAADIERHLLLAEMTYLQSEGQPTVTNLSFVERDVYTIDDKIINKEDEGRLNEQFK